MESTLEKLLVFTADLLQQEAPGPSGTRTQDLLNKCSHRRCQKKTSVRFYLSTSSTCDNESKNTPVLLRNLTVGYRCPGVPTYCPPPSGRWPLCLPSCPLDWSVTAGRRCCGKAEDRAAWAWRRCAPPPDTPAPWCCGLRLLLQWCSCSTGTPSRCGSGSGWRPSSPTAGTAAWTGCLWPSGRAERAWALGGKRDDVGKKGRHVFI